jgi:hypothetical protein
MLLILLLFPYLLATRASPLAMQTPAPTPSLTGPIATPTLAPRCGDGDCSYGGTANTLTAATVTSTILTTTSVPCYVTTYVTNSATVSSTVYSTQTVTSTVTSEGTVYVYQYSPTPVLFTSTYESVLQVTETLTTFWQSVTGTGYVSTVTDTGGYNSGNMNTWSATPAQSTGSANAWTHAGTSAAEDNAGTLRGGGATTVATVAGGWVTAGGNNGVPAGNGAVAGTTGQPGGAVVNWNAGATTRRSSRVLIAVSCVMTGWVISIV